VKLLALAAYRSQLYQRDAAQEPESAGAAPVTKVSTREFALANEGRSRHFGLMIGAEFGEPFWSRLPLAVADPLAVLPGGVR
jgi:hypothetical protein